MSSETQKLDDTIDEGDIQKCLTTVETFRTLWAKSSQGRRLQAILTANNYTVSNAIAVGLGNLDPNANRDRFRASWQLAVFLEMVQALSAVARTEHTAMNDTASNVATVPLFAQDPAFTSFDKALLSRLNIEVMDNVMDNCKLQSFLFVPFVDAVVMLPQILKGKNPALYVGTNIDLIVERMSLSMYAAMGNISQRLVDESLLIARDFLRHRQRVNVDFNGFGQASLYGLSMYAPVDIGQSVAG